MYREVDTPKPCASSHGPELAAGGMISVWSSGRFNTFVRCPACARMVNLEKIEGTCQCGEALPGPLPYW